MSTSIIMKRKILLYFSLLTYCLTSINAYLRPSFSVNNDTVTENFGNGSPKRRIFINSTIALECMSIDTALTTEAKLTEKGEGARRKLSDAMKTAMYDKIEVRLHKQLFGAKVDVEIVDEASEIPPRRIQPLKLELVDHEEVDATNKSLFHYPNGQALRAELFNNKSAVHFPPREFIYRGFAELNVTQDHMQTAINAFAILLEGTVTDVERLPADYILRSARTIAMMKITREKLAILWTVLKAGRATSEITYEELEMYRPLFKFVNAREIGRLNLKDTKILNFIGTHADLDRHQVGVVASKYMAVNPNWTDVKYLNHMNNLLCGVPMNFMRKIPSEIYLQLSHQVFYHIHACDPLQRRFYLAMMTKTEALGKSYSWSSRDVSRLGLLLAEVEGPELAAINPESMSGITAQVMMEIPASNLEYFTDIQVEYLALKSLTIFARKIKAYNNLIHNCGIGSIVNFDWSRIFLVLQLFLLNL